MWLSPIEELRSEVARVSGSAAAYRQSTLVHSHGPLGTTTRQVAEFELPTGAVNYAWLEPAPGSESAEIIVVDDERTASPWEAVRSRVSGPQTVL